MGGSSLAPEVDLRHRRRRADRARLVRPRRRSAPRWPTGSTAPWSSCPASPAARVETDSQRRAYEQAFRDAGHRPGRPPRGRDRPGSPLDEEAERGRLPASSPPTPTSAAATRALTAFGLVPSGLAGADIGRLLDEAAGIAAALADDDVDNPGLRLGALLGAASRAGADKVVLVDAETPIVGFGDWAEQLIAESTGKHGTGVLPVVVESTARAQLRPQHSRRGAGVDRQRLPVRRTCAPPPASASRVDAAARRAVAAVGARHRGRRPAARHQPVRPARRGERQGGRPRPARRRAATRPSPAFTDGGVEVHATDGLLRRRHRHRRRAAVDALLGTARPATAATSR